MGINFTNDNEVKNLRYEYTVSEIDGSISRTYGNTVIDGNEIKYYAIIKHLT
jgi:hypothetical protein